MADINELIQTITELDYWTALRADFDGAAVAWRSWSTRNAFLIVSRFATKAAAAMRASVQELAKGQFLQFATGTPLTYFAKSQYELDRQEATFTRGRIVLDLSANAAAIPVISGQLRIGTPGPVTDKSKIFVSSTGGTLQPGEHNIIEFTAEGTGDSYNLPVGSPIDLKTSLVGVTASIQASGEPTAVGSGNASLIFYAAQEGVTVEALYAVAPNESLVVLGNLGLKKISIWLPTDGASALNGTAAQVRSEIAYLIATSAQVSPLLLAVQLGGDGTGIVQPAAATMLAWAGTWIAEYGQLSQVDSSLTEDCANRWDTLGGAAGDGAPVSDAQTDSALAFWGKRPPAGRKVSPVTRIKVYSNLDDTGAVDGSATLVVIAGAAGALPSGDVSAVRANYEGPQKYSYGITLRVVSALNRTIALVGTINVKLSSGRQLAEVQTSVAAAIAAYQQSKELDIGALIQPTKLIAVVIDADRSAIDSYLQSAPAAPTALAFNEVAVFDLSALVYQYV